IGESRYVVGTNGRPNVGRSRSERRPPPEDTGPAGDAGGFTAAQPTAPDERRPAGDDPRASAAGPRVDNHNRRQPSGQAPSGQRGDTEARTQADGRRQGNQRTRPGSSTTGEQSPSSGGTVDRQSVSRWLASSFDADGFDYGIDATLHANGDTTRQRMVSNDVTATFDSLVTWFASNAGPSSPTPEALGLLLVASETTIDLPPVVIKRFAADHGLTASDSIGDLVRAAEEADGFRIE
ncbi:hypothetical protein DJ71_14165, partial [Halorubrum sp. E3]